MPCRRHLSNRLRWSFSPLLLSRGHHGQERNGGGQKELATREKGTRTVSKLIILEDRLAFSPPRSSLHYLLPLPAAAVNPHDLRCPVCF